MRLQYLCEKVFTIRGLYVKRMTTEADCEKIESFCANVHVASAKRQ